MNHRAARGILAWAAIMVFSATLAGPAVAGFLNHEHRHGKGARTETKEARPKDCTRYNGRWGYYGNPWCTPAEQRAFDLWEVRRLRSQRWR